MKPPKIVLAILVSAVAALAVACGGDDEKPERSGVSQVDNVIETVVAQDREALRGLLQFTSIPCTEGTNTANQPRCLGEAQGTAIDVFQANECEAAWVRQDRIDPVLDQVMALEPQVYAAFETPENFYVAGRYAVVFEGDDTRVDEDGLKRYMAVGVEGDTGRITGIALGCGIDEPVHFLLPHLNEGFDDWLIEP